ncbi:hypothetical protein QR680_001845 [Steinernema hermaphroditum]|uniref:Uncharacterized protein n=1 Tax=Steinernema hermaphroditum TaxID=289476 RepID=A0AA39LGV2_9BILA|nr:hypothetical protein QR680_001845 [Steinernema hermaphroditum]
MVPYSSSASSQSHMTLTAFNYFLVFILLANLSQFGSCYEGKTHYAPQESAPFGLQVKRFRTEPIRFGKRGQREPIRFGKRTHRLSLNIPHRLAARAAMSVRGFALTLLLFQLLSAVVQSKQGSNNELDQEENDDVRYLLSVVDEWPELQGLNKQRTIRSPLGTMRFGKRANLGTMRFGKRDPLGTMRFGKRDPLGTMRFGKRTPLGTMRFGKRVPLGTMRFGKRNPLGTMRFGKRSVTLGTMRFGKRATEEQSSGLYANDEM